MDTFGLTPHHIIHRVQAGCTHKPDNIIAGCANCHNHQKWVDGMPISREEARERIKEEL